MGLGRIVREWVSTAGFIGSIVAFLLGGFLVIVIGLTYAELAAAIPETGGGFVFVKKPSLQELPLYQVGLYYLAMSL